MHLSHWEAETLFRPVDAAVIGSGIVGLTAALSLREREPGLRIAVIERGAMPAGASTKNAGFACFGSLTELLDDEQTMGEDAVLDLVALRWKGLLRLRRRLGDRSIGYEPLGGFEVFAPEDEAAWQACMERMPFYNQTLADLTGRKRTYRRADARAEAFGLRNTAHLIENAAEGQLDTGRMMQSLLALARKQDILLWNGLEIKALHDLRTHVELETREGWSLRAAQAVVAVNGFARRLMPQLPVLPARNQVLVTREIPGLALRGSFHYDKGYVYFRNVGSRILLGGARNLDPAGETTDEPGLTDAIQARLEQLLRDMILPPGIEPDIERRWSGIMGVGPEKRPIVQQISPVITVAVRMGGMGVAIGSLVGEQAAALALGHTL